MRLHIRRASIAAVVMAIANLGSAFAQSREAPQNVCAQRAAPFAESVSQPQWNGWGNDSTQRRFQTAERARLPPDAVPRLKLKWAFGFPGASQAYGAPTVAGKRLFVGSADGTVYALGADTGCLYWTFKAGAPVRTAISVGKAGDRLGDLFRRPAGLRVRR